MKQKFQFPLGQNVHDSDDILKMIESLLSENFTMGEQVEKFEKAFAKYVGAKHAVMVNSGSSANLLAFSAITNYQCENQLSPGDEVLVPALCWSTSVFPIIQCGLVPIFIDVDPETLNVDLKDLQDQITNETKAIMLVHVLGNCTNMDKLMKIVKKHNLILIEDTCESLGSTYRNKYLGTFGDIGTYSFYYSHHITTIEGGMVVCDSDEHFELIKCLRAHGWSRSLKDKDKIKEQNPTISPQFTFCNLGYNVRPMEIQGMMGLNQLKKLKEKNNCRKFNYNRIKNAIQNDPNGKRFSFPKESEHADVTWFGVTLFLEDETKLSDYLDYLTKNGVENRPIITGNMVRQPVIKDLYPELSPTDFPGAEKCHFKGFFIGLSCALISESSIKELVDILLGYL